MQTLRANWLYLKGHLKLIQAHAKTQIMTTNPNNLKKLESFLTYIETIAKNLPTDNRNVMDEDDELLCKLMYDAVPETQAILVIRLGVATFSKYQFVLGMLWERYKSTESDDGLEDLLKGVDIP
jgi:hypothetical protein